MAFGVAATDTAMASRHTFYIGSDGTILFIDRAVKPSTAGADVAARLEALGIPKAKEQPPGP